MQQTLVGVLEHRDMRGASVLRGDHRFLRAALLLLLLLWPTFYDPRSRQFWQESQMRRALAVVEHGFDMRMAALLFGGLLLSTTP